MVYINDIIENMEKALKFCEGLEYREFQKDEKTYYAVIRCIEIIGEAVKNIPAGIKRKHSDVPWKDMAGMRDKLIHFYFGVDPNMVWCVLKEDMPELLPILLEIKAEIENSQK